MYGTIVDGRGAIAGLVAVKNGSDLEHLVKESEVLTGIAGRRFVVSGADRLVYRISIGGHFLEVTRLGAEDEPVHTDVVTLEDVGQHHLGAALRTGQLFTLAVD